jgi:hypothetical protein
VEPRLWGLGGTVTDDRIIDIRKFLGESLEQVGPGAFSVWGGGEERSRFALPVWRAVFLVGGDWGGIISTPKMRSDASFEPFFVLDLKEEPARTAVSPELLQGLLTEDAPAVALTDRGDLAILLGEDEDRMWFLQVRGGASGKAPGGADRETLLFLAGECAGLLFFRDLGRVESF